MDFEDRLTPGLVREVNHDAPVESSGPQERFVEHVRLIRRRQHDDALPAREAVHLGENLV